MKRHAGKGQQDDIEMLMAILHSRAEQYIQREKHIFTGKMIILELLLVNDKFVVKLIFEKDLSFPLY